MDLSTQARIREIRGRLEAATPGRWAPNWSGGVTGPTAAVWGQVQEVADRLGLGEVGIVTCPDSVWAGAWYASVICRTPPGKQADAEFIACAPQDIAWLLHRVRTLESRQPLGQRLRAWWERITA
jgi:hypothetical protein